MNGCLRLRPPAGRCDVRPLEIGMVLQEARYEILGDGLGIFTVLGGVLLAECMQFGQNVGRFNLILR